LKDNGAPRRHDAKIFLSTAPRSVKEAATATSVTQILHSKVEQVVNGVSHGGGKLASYEPNYWRLDGSFMLPRLNFESQMEVGFASMPISDTRGNFANPPEITINFAAPQNIENISVVYDAATGEIVETARFTAFNASNQQVFEETITNNFGLVMATTRGGFNISRIIISFIKTVTPRRRARVMEVHFGPVIVFDGDDIVEIDNLKQTDPSGRSLPANRLRVRFLNKGRYSLLDEDGHIKHLQQKAQIEHHHGIITGARHQWSHCGNFYLANHSVHENHVDIMAYGRALDLAESTFMQSGLINSSPTNIARFVASDAGINVVTPQSWIGAPLFPEFFGNISHRAVLANIAEMTCSLLYEDNNGTFHFIDAIANNKNEAQSLGYEEMFGQPRIGLDANYNGILLRESTFLLESGTQTVTRRVTGGEDIVIPFDRPIVRGGTATASAGFSLTNVVFRQMYMTAHLTGNGTCDIQIGGMRAVASDNEVFYPAPWFLPGQERHPYRVTLPVFIHNSDHMAAAREWFLRRKFEMLKQRITCTATWRQNPAIALAQPINIQADRKGRVLQGQVIRQELVFNRGVLRGATEARG